ncbi:hypothetical protein [Roseateles albus]|uniref:Uncharacterized protein n=1 Tax=Roseateles albus TaxID=2987525 RepID=A0ABT5KKT1_9BURK|nr:hypothetical protein [Roseateles albus]MDC8774490.1 hypothetical protein [Roseateles albus]
MKNFEFEPPYYAVIFTSQRNSVELGYAETADRMVELAAQQTGYLVGPAKFVLPKQATEAVPGEACRYGAN